MTASNNQFSRNKRWDTVFTVLGVAAVTLPIAYLLFLFVTAKPEPPPAALPKTTGTPLQRDLANGVFREGDPMEKLLEKYPPTHRIDHPPFSTLIYVEGAIPQSTWDLSVGLTNVPAPGGVKVAVKDGRLLAAIGNEEEDPTAPSRIKVYFVDWSGNWLEKYVNTLVEAVFQPHAAAVGGWFHINLANLGKAE